MTLTGQFARNLDQANRVAVPKRLREQFSEEQLSSLYVAPGTEQSLSLYAPAAFDRLAQQLAERSSNRLDVRNYKRLFFARAEEVALDSQSRVRIPERLVELARLKRDVVLVGAQDHAEIWDRELWEAFIEKHSSDFDDIATQAYE